jgi:predicted GNAT family N-acyltransferase
MISNYEQEDLWGNEIYLQINQDGLTLKPVVSPIDQWHVTNIRELVFRKEQKVPYEEDEVLEEELQAKTYLIYLKDKVIGTIRYRLVNEAYKIERFAILKEYRGKGYGKQAFNYFVDMLAADYNPCTITLNSQEPVI